MDYEYNPTQAVVGEPEPIWQDAPRYVPEASFPPYRFVPGVNPHPTEDEGGHSFDKSDHPDSLHPWRECTDYLFGIDLYHQGYLWESHEAWEGLWRNLPDDSVERQLLQALIFNSAAQLKNHMGITRGATIHSQRAYNILQEMDPSMDPEKCMGLDIGQLRSDIERHYGPLWQDENGQTAGPAPRIWVTI